VRVLAVDPGRQKCGIAVCAPGKILAHRVVSLGDLASVAAQWTATFRVERVVIGAGTGARGALDVLAGLSVAVLEVNEVGTTLAARARYFDDHPPRGWRRLLPRSLLTPAEPYDDYAAIVLGEAYLAREAERRDHSG